MNISRITFLSALLFAFIPPFVLAETPTTRLRIGAILPLTGQDASIGVAIQNGIRLAQKESPDLFANIEFDFQDNQLDPKLALSAYRLLVDQKHLRLIFLTGGGHVVCPLADTQDVVILHFGFEADVAAGRKHVLRSMNYTSQYMGTLVDYLRKSKLQSYTLVSTEFSFFNKMIQGMRDSLNAEEKINSLSTVNPSEHDFRPTLLKLKSSGVKTLGLFLFPNQLAEFMRHAKELGLEFELYGTDLFETAAKISDPALFEGALYPDNQVNESFRERYVKEYGADQQITFAGNAYDMAMITASQLHSVEGMPAEKIMEAFMKTAPAEGVLGKYTPTSDQEGGKYFQYPIVVKRIENGHGVLAK